jgi:hypothetical protein
VPWRLLAAPEAMSFADGAVAGEGVIVSPAAAASEPNVLFAILHATGRHV